MQRPIFRTKQEYGPVFTDVAYWQPYLAEVCRRHGSLPCADLRAGLAGTNPVFIVEGRVVVKFYVDLFGGAESVAAEMGAYQLLARAPGVAAPQLLAQGELFPGAEWPWPYAILSLVAGDSLGERVGQVSPAEWEAMARWLGPMLRQLHGIALDSTGPLASSWRPYRTFLAQQIQHCVANHTNWGSLPPALIAQIPAYLPPLDVLIDEQTLPSLVHADLNWDHVLVAQYNGRWQPTGMIDFGDALVGDPLYDFVVVYAGLFRFNPALLELLLDTYNPPPLMLRNGVRRAMALTLLHRFNMFDTLFAERPAARAASTLSELAYMLWGELEERG